jgi:hypothetical protein
MHNNYRRATAQTHTHIQAHTHTHKHTQTHTHKHKQTNTNTHTHTHTLRIRNTFLFSCNSGCTNAPHCYLVSVCCILRGERIVDVVPGGTEFEPHVKTGSWAGLTHSQ